MSLYSAPRPLPPLGIGTATVNELAALMHQSLSPEQLARVAARHALVALKQSFMRAADELSGPDADWLRRRVRMANDSTELWRLRPTIFALLPEGNSRSDLHRSELNRQLDSIFPESAYEDTVPQPALSDIPPQLRPG
jgi:hypothetical protein